LYLGYLAKFGQINLLPCVDNIQTIGQKELNGTGLILVIETLDNECELVILGPFLYITGTVILIFNSQVCADAVCS
jgi:hypothetical protein